MRRRILAVVFGIMLLATLSVPVEARGCFSLQMGGYYDEATHCLHQEWHDCCNGNCTVRWVVECGA